MPSSSSPPDDDACEVYLRAYLAERSVTPESILRDDDGNYLVRALGQRFDVGQPLGEGALRWALNATNRIAGPASWAAP